MHPARARKRAEAVVETVFPGTTPPLTPALRMLPPPIPPEHPLASFSEGPEEDALHPPCALDALSACLEEWGGWQGRENRPSRKRKAWTGGAHRRTRSARGSGRLRDAPHVSTGALHTPQTASNASGKASDFRRIEPKV